MKISVGLSYGTCCLQHLCQWSQPGRATCGAPSREAVAYPASVFYKLSGQILTLCEADGTVAIDAVRGTLHGNS